MSLLLTVFELFPPLAVPSVEKNIIPLDELPSEPIILQYFMVLFVADSIKRTLEAEFPELVLVIAGSLASDLFTLPSMVILSSPLRSISGPSIFPLIVRLGLVG